MQSNIFHKIEKIAKGIRSDMISVYGEDLAGECIEASEKIVSALQKELGLEAKTVEGWCRYDDECYGSDRPWDPHTWAEIPSLGMYVDVTADQFNYGMAIENEYPEVIVQKGLPHGMQYEEPIWPEYEEILAEIDVSKITDSARISVVWNSFGIAVDFNYSYDESLGYGESVLCFCENYEDGAPNAGAWEDAQHMGEFLLEEFQLPIDISKEVPGWDTQLQRPSLISQIQDASNLIKESNDHGKTLAKQFVVER